MDTPPAGDLPRVIALEREVHELRQQLIRKEAELNRRESGQSKKLKLQNELNEVNKTIETTSQEITALHQEIHDYQMKLFTDQSPSPQRTLSSSDMTDHAVGKESKTEREIRLEEMVDNAARSKKSALRIVLRLLRDDILEVIRSCREDDPTVDLVDLVEYALHHPGNNKEGVLISPTRQPLPSHRHHAAVASGLMSSPTHLKKEKKVVRTLTFADSTIISKR
eukprot:gene1220-1336_t